MRKQLILAAGILLMGGVSVLPGDSPAFAEPDLAGRFLFLNEHKPTPEVQLEGKPWTEEERQKILQALDQIAGKAPGLVERAAAYRPVRLYRVERIGRENAAAITITKNLSLFLGDIFFYGDDEAQLESLAHEMVHLADPFMNLAGGKSWKDLVQPGIDRVQARLNKKREGLTVHQAMIEGQSDAAARDAATAIVLKEGFPSLWSSLSLNEALAEYTMRMVFLDFSPPAGVQAFIRENVLKAPFAPEPSAQSLHQGLAAQEKGDLAGAIGAFDQAIALDETQSGAFQFRAEAWEKKGDLDRAIADYGQAIALGASSETYFKRGQLYAKKGDSDRAIADFGETVQRAPWLEKGWEARAEEWIKKNELDKAVNDFSEILKLNPAYLSAYGRRGDIFAHQKDFDKAIADYSAVIQANPSMATAYARRAECYANKGEMDPAIADLTQLLAIDPSHAAAYQMRARAWVFKKNWDKAASDMSEAIRFNPDDTAAYDFRAKIWYNKKDYDRAIADFSEIIKRNPAQAIPYYMRGKVWHSKREFAEAVEDYKTALRLDPRGKEMVQPQLERAEAKQDLVEE